jgi:hypothetical protein
LRLRIAKKKLADGFTPEISYIELPVGKSKIGEYEHYFNNGENRDKEVVISNIEWEKKMFGN